MDNARRSLIAASAMLCTGAAALWFKPAPVSSATGNAFDLQALVPKQFGQWTHEPDAGLVMVDPQTKQLLDKIYNQILSRTYRDPAGYRVMLSIAYGSDQRGALQAHRPEVCYPAQGFMLHQTEDATLKLDAGTLNVRRIRSSLGARHEPITYWFTIGEQAVITPLDRRIAELRSIMTGRIPDGLLFRVSSIDGDAGAAFARQAAFVSQLLAAVPPAARMRLSGL